MLIYCTLQMHVQQATYANELHVNVQQYMLWFNFIPGLIFIFFCFKLIIIYYHTQKQKKIKIKPRIKLNHNMYTNTWF